MEEFGTVSSRFFRTSRTASHRHSSRTGRISFSKPGRPISPVGLERTRPKEARSAAGGAPRTARPVRGSVGRTRKSPRGRGRSGARRSLAEEGWLLSEGEAVPPGGLAGLPHPGATAVHFERRFFLQDPAVVARDLLGCCIRSSGTGNIRSEGVIIETEAYVGPQDPASHAAARIGKTERNKSMFGPPGRAYVFRIYGVHWCLNVVTGKVGFPAAVLIRALDPISGLETMACRREGRTPLCAGPGRLAQALEVTGELDGHDLRHPPLQLLRGWTVAPSDVAISGRVGVKNAADWPLRFYLREHSDVSRPDPTWR